MSIKTEEMTFSELKRLMICNSDRLTKKLIVLSNNKTTKKYTWVGIGLIEEKSNVNEKQFKGIISVTED